MRKAALLLSGVCAGLLVLGAALLMVPPPIAGAVVLAAAAAALLLAVSAWLATARQHRLQRGEGDLFLACNARRSEAAIAAGQRPVGAFWRRAVARGLFGHRHLVGDTVRVKSLAQIGATLDGNRSLDGLPFMDEMAMHCGQQLTVYRIVDKIYDYGRSRRMRSLDATVLLTERRCDGSAHGGCEAACYLIWKTQWLVPADAAPTSAPVQQGLARPAVQPAAATPTYRCQYTQLAEASAPMSGWNLSRTLGPWLVGNVTLAAFCVALLTRLFNAFQAWRGGPAYPWQPAAGGDKTAAGQALKAGEWVRVRPAAEIARTLDTNSKNRGLWFDRDMLKHCGSTHRVRGRIQQIIDVTSGAMIPMKTACIALEDVHYSGEFQGFGEQHDYLYWREAWLERVEGARQLPD